MKLELQLFGLPATDYVPVVRRADELGFESVWISDHLVTPIEYGKVYPYTDSGDPGFRGETPLVDVPVMLGHLAAVTSRVKLGAGVYVLPMRRPVPVALAWSTLQAVSEGRAVLGIGVGWMREEFDAVGEDFANRGSRTDEMLDIIDGLWTGRPFSYRGRHYSLGPVQMGGTPPTPIPKVFGGHGDRSLRRAAERGDGWFGPNVKIAETVRLRDRIEVLRAAAGRGSVPFSYHVRLAGGQDVANAARYRDAGFHHLVLSPFAALPPGADLAGRLAALDELAERLATVRD